MGETLLTIGFGLIEIGVAIAYLLNVQKYLNNPYDQEKWAEIKWQTKALIIIEIIGAAILLMLIGMITLIALLDI